METTPDGKECVLALTAYKFDLNPMVRPARCANTAKKNWGERKKEKEHTSGVEQMAKIERAPLGSCVCLSPDRHDYKLE